MSAGRRERFSGFGRSSWAEGFHYKPSSPQELAETFAAVRRDGLRAVLRGAGLSYGDANFASEAAVIDMTAMRRVLAWDAASGRIEAEGGATIADVWRCALPDGWWPPVVSGTMFPTLGGALAMNIHGKNNPEAGLLGEHVEEVDVLLPSGEVRTIRPNQREFRAVVSGFGMLGAIVRVVLRLRRVRSGDLDVTAVRCANWDEQFDAFRRFDGRADYRVSWVDAFARGRSFGRGLFHAARYAEPAGGPEASLAVAHQELSLRGRHVVAVLRALNSRRGMRLTNALKQAGGRLEASRPYRQSLVAFSFLLDYVPNWRDAYLPGGFLQFQSFVPKERAPEVFAHQLELLQEAGREPFLAVLKRHRPDSFLFSHGVDGYSLALDLKLTDATRAEVTRLTYRMTDLALEAGGRFYFAKDSTLRPEDARAFLGEGALAEFRSLRRAMDPEGVLTSALARRLRLDG